MIIELTELMFLDDKTVERKIWIRPETVVSVREALWTRNREGGEKTYLECSLVTTVSGGTFHAKESPVAFVGKL